MRRKFLFLGAVVAAAVALGLFGSRPHVPSSEAVPAADSIVADASDDLTLTTSHQPVPGLSLTLDSPNAFGPGYDMWKVEVCLLFQGTGSGDEGRSAAFRLLVDDTPVDGAGVTRLYSNIFQTTCYVWLLDIDAPDQTVTVTARKDTGATGDSMILQGALNTTSRMVATPDLNAGAAFEANADANLVLTDTHQDVPNLSVEVPGHAYWKVEVCLLFQGTGSGDEGRSAAFRLLLDGNPVDGAGVTRLYSNIFQTTCYAWLLEIDAPSQTVTITARKDTGATGDSMILAGDVINHTSRMIVSAAFAFPLKSTNADADLDLADFHQAVPNLSLDLSVAGKWKVEVCLLFQGTGAGDEGRSAAFRLLVGGTAVDGAGVTRLYSNIFQTTCYIWLLDLASPSEVVVTARKDTGATGDSMILQGALNTTSRMIASKVP